MRALPDGQPRLGLRAIVAVAAATLALLGTSPAHAAAAQEPPTIDAASWLLIDSADGTELASRRPGEERAIASTTKLMTAYLALKKLRMNQKLTVPAYSAAPAESVAGLIRGERLTVSDLITAMMLPSANDAAATIADGVSGSQAAFVSEMNRAASALGLERTSYANPIGLDARENYSTAQDLTDLSLELLSDRRFRRIVDQPQATLKSGAQPRVVQNTNTLLLSDPSVDGVKTGHTLDAGYVLVASAKRDGVPLIAAVLGAPSEAQRDVSTAALLDYGYSLYDRRRAVERGEEVASADVAYEDEDLALEAEREVEVSVRRDQRVRVDVEAPAEVEGPIAAGQRLGEATVTVDGKFEDRVPLTASRAVDEPTFVDRIGGPIVLVVAALVLIVILAAVAFWIRRRGRGERLEDRDPEERMRTRQERIRKRNGEGSE